MKEPTKRVGIAAGIGMFLMFASYIAEYILDRNGISPADTLLDNILIGLCAGLLVYAWATLLTERESRNLLVENLKQEAVSEERHRVAREIHDTVAQALMAVSLQLEAAKDVMESNAVEALVHIDRAQSVAREGLTEARRVVWALHPEALESDNLAGALRRLTNRIADHREMNAEFSLRGNPCSAAGEIESNVLRIAQEALSNVVKHSGARKVRVELAYGKQGARLLVQDNGKGMQWENSKSRRGFGMTSMQERSQRIGAQLSIESRRGSGTRIELTFPFHIHALKDMSEEKNQSVQGSEKAQPA